MEAIKRPSLTNFEQAIIRKKNHEGNVGQEICMFYEIGWFANFIMNIMHQVLDSMIWIGKINEVTKLYYVIQSFEKNIAIALWFESMFFDQFLGGIFLRNQSFLQKEDIPMYIQYTVGQLEIKWN